MTTLPVATFLAGVAVGLAVAMPIGPMGMLCIQRTLGFGLAGGIATGLAAATVQGTYGLVAVLGFSPAATAFISTGAGLLSGVSAALLFWFAFRALRREIVIRAGPAGGRIRFLRSYADALTVGFANPLTVVLFLAAFPALTSAEDALEAPVLVGGVLAGAIGWYVALSATVACLRERLPPRALTFTNQVAAVALAGLGCAMAASALGLPLR